MDKHKIVLEYPLQTKSENIVWQLIGTAEGLGKWIADYVTRDGDTMTFTWGEVWTQRHKGGTNLRHTAQPIHQNEMGLYRT